MPCPFQRLGKIPRVADVERDRIIDLRYHVDNIVIPTVQTLRACILAGFVAQLDPNTSFQCTAFDLFCDPGNTALRNLEIAWIPP